MPTFQERLEHSLKFLRRPSAAISFVIGFGVAIIVALVLVAIRFIFLGFDFFTNDAQLADQAAPAEILTVTELPSEGFDNSELPVVYQIARGDSSWSIAEAFYGCGLDYIHIERSNNLQRDALLEVGEELVIPAIQISRCDPGYELAQDEIDQTVTDNPEIIVETEMIDTTPQVDDSTQAPEQTYTVQKGDSLWKIAEQLTGNGYNWVELYHANQSTVGSNPDLIYPDTVLTTAYLLQ